MQPRSQLTEIDRVLSILLGHWELKREDKASRTTRVPDHTSGVVDGKPPSGSTQEILIHAGVGSRAGCYMRQNLNAQETPLHESPVLHERKR